MKIRLGIGFAILAGAVIWFVLNAPSMNEWTQGYWTGVFMVTLVTLVGRFLEGVYAGWKEWKASQP